MLVNCGHCVVLHRPCCGIGIYGMGMISALPFFVKGVHRSSVDTHHKKPAKRIFDVFFVMLNKHLNKGYICRWFAMSRRSSDVTGILHFQWYLSGKYKTYNQLSVGFTKSTPLRNKYTRILIIRYQQSIHITFKPVILGVGYKRAFITSVLPLTARFMGPTWGPPGSCRPQVGLM